jgi:hypothetical protein
VYGARDAPLRPHWTIFHPDDIESLNAVLEFDNPPLDPARFGRFIIGEPDCVCVARRAECRLVGDALGTYSSRFRVELDDEIPPECGSASEYPLASLRVRRMRQCPPERLQDSLAVSWLEPGRPGRRRAGDW